MKQLEEIDPELIDQAVRAVVRDRRRAPDKEVAIATHVSESPEIMEWVELMAKSSPPFSPWVRSMSAICIGMEVGYQLGLREAKRSA